MPGPGPKESISEKVTVTVTNSETTFCPECGKQSLFKSDQRHWSCSDCDTQFLIQKEI